MTQIKPIQTYYNGYWFRSRLEARWAVFFDAMGIEYRYEDEGYTYWDDRYQWLPDFTLPEYDNLLVEVKGGDDALKKDWERLAMAIDYLNTPASNGLLILGDIPNPNDIGFGSVPVFSYLEWSEGIKCDFAAFLDRFNKKNRFIKGIDTVFESTYGYNWRKFEKAFTSGEGDMPKCVSTKYKMLTKDEMYSLKFEKLSKAYRIARQARFEHGETPKVESVFDDD